MHMALSPSITSGLAKGCKRSRSCSRVRASPSWPYSRTFVDWSVHSSSARRLVSTGSRAPATAAATNTIVAKTSTPGEPATL